MNSSLLLRRLIVASAAVTAACGARTGDEPEEPAHLLGDDTGTAGRGGGSAGAAGAAQAGKGGSTAGKAGAAGAAGATTKIVTGCFDGASCVPSAWCQNTSGTICECDAAGNQHCGKSTPWGMKTKVCFELSTPDLPCPNAGDPSLYQLLPWQLGCTGIEGGPEFHYVANSVEHPACCYDVGNFGCGGRPFVVSERGWTSRLVARADWA